MKKAFIKKPLSAALAVLVALSSLALVGTAPAAAAGEEYQSLIVYDKAFCDQYSEAVDALVNCVKNCDESVDIESLNFPTSSVGDLLAAVVYTHPELFWLDYISYDYYDSGTVGSLYPVYIDTYMSNLDEMKAQFESCADKYLESVNLGMSDFEKALVLHDEIALNSSYILNTDVYDLMVSKLGRCYCYAGVYSYLLSRVGVKTEQVLSDDMNHQWTKVCIDGDWYNVDVTWDDPDPAYFNSNTYEAHTIEGYVDHKYFLLSDQAIQSMDNPHYNYTVTNEATRPNYDNWGFHDSNAKIWFDGNYCYYVNNEDNSSSAGGKSLWKLDYKNYVEERLFNIQDLWNITYADQYSYTYSKGSYSGLAMYDGILYWNTPRKIYAYNPQTKVSTEFWNFTDEEMEIYGMKLVGNELYAAVSDDPNNMRHLTHAAFLETSPVQLLGDVDGDGVVTVNDATEIQRSIANLISLTPSQKIAADVDCSGDITVSDATMIQKYIANVITSLG